jgi:hypothetical protein
MANTTDQLFATFATRVAEILREHFRMDPGPLLRVRHELHSVEGLVRSSEEGGPEWFTYTASRERLQWNGPDAMASDFVREYQRHRSAAR